MFFFLFQIGYHFFRDENQKQDSSKKEQLKDIINYLLCNVPNTNVFHKHLKFMWWPKGV
jgi:hypothetical protein